MYDGDQMAITCPIRFRQDWRIATDAAGFFFPPGTLWTSLTEIRLNDRNNTSAGNIDVVLVAYDEQGNVTDFGALEVQAVYISGNIRKPFAFYYDATEELQALAQRYGFDTQRIAMKNTHHAAMTELLIGRNLDWVR